MSHLHRAVGHVAQPLVRGNLPGFCRARQQETRPSRPPLSLPILMSVSETRTCRVCGSSWPYPSHYWITEGGGCRTCGGSPLCDSCGHPPATHLAVFRKGQGGCSFTALDVQSLSHIPCSCKGYVPVAGALSDAGFAQPDDGPLPRLRPPAATRS
jgi:hypothetical protein